MASAPSISPLHALNDLLRNNLDDLSLADLFCESSKLLAARQKANCQDQTAQPLNPANSQLRTSLERTVTLLDLG